MTQEPEVIFRETQQLRSLRFWGLMVFLSVPLMGFVTFVMVRQLALGRPVGNEAIPEPLLVGAGSFIVLGFAVFLIVTGFARLVTEVRLKGTSIWFFPFHRAPIRIQPQDLKRLEVKNFKSVQDLRTWEDRSLQRNHIFSVSGNRGVYLELESGRCYFVGSNHPEQLARALLHTVDPEAYPIGGCLANPPSDAAKAGGNPAENVKK